MNKLKTILIDDEDASLQQLNSLLARHKNIEVDTLTTDAAYGLKQIKTDSFNLAFLDIEMPGINGLEIAQELKETKPEVKVIFVTAYNQYAIQAIKQAAFDYLLKPVDPDELKNTINRLSDELIPSCLPKESLQEKFCLTGRELEVLRKLLEGKQRKDIAEELNISIFTVKTHHQNIHKKLGTGNICELMKICEGYEV